jgi:SAM-dependent methyltransferase
MSTTELPEHLGGHLNKVHTDRSTLLYLKGKYNIESMIDVGCGPGDMVELANLRGIVAVGVDGDFTLQEQWKEKDLHVYLHDFTHSPTWLPENSGFDLGWSVEFLEHVEEKYMDNYMKVFEKCNYVVCTAAPPGYTGHHHVNCQPQEYWVKKFAEYGFEFDAKETANIRAISGMRKPFMQRTGMFFKTIGVNYG